jgi:hypothetical protein
MKRIAKFITAIQALLLAPLGAVKPSHAATPSDLTETAAWEAAVSTGSPEALQQFISHFPQGERLSEAFGLIVQVEVEAAKSATGRAATDLQLSEARPEILERNFDRGVGRKYENQNEDNRGLNPY